MPRPRARYTVPLLRDILAESELSTTDFSSKSAVSNRTIKRVLSGKPVSKNSALKIARLLSEIDKNPKPTDDYVEIDPPEPWT